MRETDGLIRRAFSGGQGILGTKGMPTKYPAVYDRHAPVGAVSVGWIDVYVHAKTDAKFLTIFKA
jgi:hypothetical protein